VLSAVAARWRSLANGFWFLPGLVALGFAVVAFVLIRVDRALGGDRLGFTFDGDAGAARGVLETVAGSLITVAGLAFSLTVVVLVLVSGQFTPRSVPAFLADRVNQATAGTFIGVFTYCLLVLRTVRDEDDSGAGGFVPQLSVTVAVALAVIAIALLLYFIHHLGVSIQASSIVNRIGADTLARVEKLPHEPAAGPAEPASPPGHVHPRRPGFVRHVALGDLADRLDDRCEHVRLRVAVGDFVSERDVLADVWPADAAGEVEDAIRRGIALGLERDLHQDVLYGLRQLAEIAMKGLSPGVNDPSTAESALGYLRAALERLAERPLPPEARRGRLVAPLRSFDDLVEGAFVQVGRYAAADATVVVTLLDALARVGDAARQAGRGERTAVLRATAEDVAAPALEDARTERDRERIRAALARVAP
jgi:uncharacterized membrane protein